MQRGLLFIALAFVLILIYQRWLEEQTPPPVTVADAPTGSVKSADIPKAPEASATPTDVPISPAPAPGASSADGSSGSAHVVVTTDLLRVEIDTAGGDLVSAKLVTYPITLDEPGVPFKVLKQEGADIFITQSGLIGHDRELPNHKTLYKADKQIYKLEPGTDRIQVPLFWESADGVKYQKIYTLYRGRYDLLIDYLVDNRSSTPWSGYLYAQFQRTEVVPDRGLFLNVAPSYLGGAIYTPQEKYEKIDFSEMIDADLNRGEISNGWIAMLQHYFVSAWFPQPPGPYQFYSSVNRHPEGPRYNIGYKTLSSTKVEAGQQGKLSTRLYVGPKEQDRLRQQEENFVLTVDYGWLTPVSAPLFWVLKQIHSIVKNWGWAIIILTLLIKLAFYPLSAASYKSMAKMKKLQPRLQTLKERYGDDKQKLQQAMMELYKKDKINPLGGCLPIVIQIPVFIALYWVLLESVELRQADWALWINDLSVKDPYFVLPILMGLSMVAQQFLNPSPLDPMQKKIMMALPIVFTVLFLYFPAGLVLYWLVNNVLSIAQQWYINRTIGVKNT